MASGRGIAMIAIMLVASGFLFHCDAVTYKVGDSAGWTFNVSNWPNGKIFKEQHSVADVTETEYNKCIIPSTGLIYQTGDDKIAVTPGKKFFSDAIPGNCELGVKIAVDVWPA